MYDQHHLHHQQQQQQQQATPVSIKSFLTSTNPNYQAPPQLHQSRHQDHLQSFQQFPMFSPPNPLSPHKELSQMSLHPSSKPTLFHPPPPPVPTRNGPKNLKYEGKPSTSSSAGDSSVLRSSEVNHFITTPLPHHGHITEGTTPLPLHGPMSGYGYTTTNSFVNVQYGSSHMDHHHHYPFSKTIGSQVDHSICLCLQSTHEYNICFEGIEYM